MSPEAIVKNMVDRSNGWRLQGEARNIFDGEWRGPEEVGESGTLICWIHPFHRLYFLAKRHVCEMPEIVTRILEENEDLAGVTLELRRYLIKIGNFLATTEEEQLLVAEQDDRVGETIELMRLMGYGNDLMYYATEKNSPEPTDGSWEDVYGAVVGSGYKRLIVGGMYCEHKVGTIVAYGRSVLYRLESVDRSGVREMGLSNYDNLKFLRGCTRGFMEEMISRYRQDWEESRWKMPEVILSPIIYGREWCIPE